MRLRKVVIRIPTAEDLECQRMVRQFNEKHGRIKRQPHRCTCAVDHGWHMPDGSTRANWNPQP